MAEIQMSKEQRKENGKRLGIWNATKEQPLTCLRPGCNNPATQSHWLQRRGLLSNITAPDKHLVEWTPGGAFTTGSFKRESARKSEMMAFPGFCNDCDKAIFLPIERGKPVFSDFRHQLLFSYRVMLNAYRKMEFLINVDINSFHPNSGLKAQTKERMQNGRIERMAKFKILEYYKGLFENEIYGEVEQSAFQTFHVSLPKADVAAALFLGEMAVPPMTYLEVAAIDPVDLVGKSYISNFFALVISTDTSTELILCWPDGSTGSESHPLPSIDKLNKMSHKDFFKMISDFLIGGGDNWAISDERFEKLKADGSHIEAMNIKDDNIDRVIYGVNTDFRDFNMFKDLT